MELDPTRLTPMQRYKLLIGCIVPRPIAFVSTVSPDGAPNLAPYSFFNGVGSDPMTLLFCPANGPDGITVRGQFELRRIADVDVLNNGWVNQGDCNNG